MDNENFKINNNWVSVKEYLYTKYSHGKFRQTDPKLSQGTFLFACGQLTGCFSSAGLNGNKS